MTILNICALICHFMCIYLAAQNKGKQKIEKNSRSLSERALRKERRMRARTDKVRTG